MKLKNFKQFLNEDNAIVNAKKKLDAAAQKSDRTEDKGEANTLEVALRKREVKYLEDKEKAEQELKTANDQENKGRAKDDLYKLNHEWQSDKKAIVDKIKNLRKYAKK